MRKLLGTLVILIASQMVHVTQQPVSPSTKEQERGRALYQKGDYQGAVRSLCTVLEDSERDLQSWHYLGLALEKMGQTKDARRAHEKAAKLGDELLDTLFDKLERRIEGNSFREVHELLSMASTSTERYIVLSGDLSQSKQEEWNDRLEVLRIAVEWSSGERQLFRSSERTTGAQVIVKPEPTYTVEARRNHITG